MGCHCRNGEGKVESRLKNSIGVGVQRNAVNILEWVRVGEWRN
jgi:hypothetical protein